MTNTAEQGDGSQAGGGLDIAVVGMAGRFPGARNLESFWQNLRDGIESVSTLSREDLLESGVDEQVLDRPNYVRARALLDDVDLFDARLFNMTPNEAASMDPQQRLLLECAWETLEQAGYDPEQYGGTIGVYAGSSSSGYLFNLFPRRTLLQSAADMSAMLGVEKDALSTRVSYKLNLEGPSLAVQTACSTSLVAVHLACQGLLSGECDMALAGGVSVTVPQKVGYLYQEGGIVSPDGHCRAFDADAQGTVGGSGVGLVLLKRRQEAEADGDQVLAIIKGSAINNDGAAKVGYTAPRIEGQAKVIKAAHLAAGVTPESISYVEAHGTGTPMGDPIEVAALTQAFRASTDRSGFCALGSVKTNIGHLDAAAGIAGLIKTILALSHRQIPASLHYVRSNPAIDFAQTPFYVNAALKAWPRGDNLRRAGVSSFGLGGTNAHVVLEEASPAGRAQSPARDSGSQLLVLSAGSERALSQATDRLAAHLGNHPDLSLADVAHTLQAGRKALPYRRWVVATRTAQAAELLARPGLAGATSGPVGGGRRAAFMFSGQGAQYPGMGQALYAEQSVFREQVDLCASLLQRQLGRDIRSILFANRPEDQDLIHQTVLTQPALFVFEYALARLWMSWGVIPCAMIGHSLGEYVAACLSGVFSLEDALAVVARRGRLMQDTVPGTMLAVPLAESEVAPFLRAGVDLAAVNAPAQCVLSGHEESLAALDQELTARGIKSRRLRTSHAFHSSTMDSVLKPFESFLAGLTMHPPRIPWVSNVTAGWIHRDQAVDPRYWARHLRSTVRFSDGIKTLLEQGGPILLEVGPGRTLQHLARRHAGQTGLSAVASLNGAGPASSGQPEMSALLTTLGSLWGAGVCPDWNGLYAGEPRRRVPLPTYPFERQRYWVEPDSSHAGRKTERSDRRLDMSRWAYQPSWKRSVLGGGSHARPQEQWLVFVEEPRVGMALVNHLNTLGHQVTTVLAGQAFERRDGDTYLVRADSREDHDRLLRDLKTRGRLPSNIVQAWTIGEETPAAPATVQFNGAQEKGFFHLLLLAQVFGRRRGEGCSILVLSQGLHDVTGRERLRPEQATLLAACRVIPQEYPRLTCRLLDLDDHDVAHTLSEASCHRLTAEVGAPAGEAIVAYRGPHRWVQTFEPLPLPEGKPMSGLLREGGVYLITGGLGGVGLALADYLIRTLQARVILTSRSLPNGEQQEVLAGLERLGGKVLPLQADVADLPQMRAAIAEAGQRFGSIHGVFHAAAVAGGGLIDRTTPESVRDEFRPKVAGALVLEEALREAPPEFVLFCSSLTAVVGGIGQVASCAANAFLDAMAHASTSARMPVLSVNFDRWSQVGMAVQAEARMKALGLSDEALDGMSRREGQDVVHRILQGAALPQVVVSIRELSTVATSVTQLALAQFHGPDQTAGHDVAPSATIAEGQDVSEQEVARLWQQLLGIDRVGVDEDFFRLGGESLSALQILNRVQERFGVELSLRDFYAAPTVQGLTQQIRGARSAGEQPEVKLLPLPREARRLRGASV